MVRYYMSENDLKTDRYGLLAKTLEAYKRYTDNIVNKEFKTATIDALTKIFNYNLNKFKKNSKKQKDKGNQCKQEKRIMKEQPLVFGKVWAK